MSNDNSGWLAVIAGCLFIIIIVLATSADTYNLNAESGEDLAQYPDQTPYPTDPFILDPAPNINLENETLTNGIWCHTRDYSSNFIAKCIAGNITDVYVDAGEYTNTYTVAPLDDGLISQADFATACHDAGLRCWGWVHWRYPHHYYPIDITNATNRQIMADNAVAFCAARGFDGVQDDLEPFHWVEGGVLYGPYNIIGDYMDYADFLNKLGTAAATAGIYGGSSINIASATRSQGMMEALSTVTTLSLGKFMLYNGGPYSSYEIQEALTALFAINPQMDVLLGLRAYNGNLSASIEYVTNASSMQGYSTYVKGYGLFEYAEMQPWDWTAWNAWTLKNYTTQDPTDDPEQPPDEEPDETPIPVEPAEYYYVNTEASVGGLVSPVVSLLPVLVGTTFTVVATAGVDYKFDYGTRNGATVPWVNGSYRETRGMAGLTYTYKAYFTANPPIPPDTPVVPDPTYWRVVVESTSGGSVIDGDGDSAETTYTLAIDEDLTAIAVPADNNMFTYWLFDSVYYSPNLTVTVPAQSSASAHTLKALFQPVPPPPLGTPIPLSDYNVGLIGSSEMFNAAKTLVAQSPVSFTQILSLLEKAKF